MVVVVMTAARADPDVYEPVYKPVSIIILIPIINTSVRPGHLELRPGHLELRPGHLECVSAAYVT